jgi:hypothetical protein
MRCCADPLFFVSGKSRSSTRRLYGRPSAVSLLAIGKRSPKPW